MSKVSNRDLYNADRLWGGDGLGMGAKQPRAKRQKTDTVPEWKEQQAVIEWWAAFCRTKQLDERLLFAIPNGSFMRGGLEERKVQLIILSKTGTRRGAPDLMLAIPRSGSSGLFVEMKSEVGRTSVDQDEYHELLERMGYRTKVCYGADEAIETIKGYLG